MQHSTSLPELLAPAGSEESLHAAVENGADAVYFGLSGIGFNARARAKNFPLETLGDTIAFLHQRDVKGYITLNTLVLSEELPTIESLLEKIVQAKVDAVIVQDLGVARLVRQSCPKLAIHASTQMSLTSLHGIRLAQTLGIQRIVLPRELSIEQISLLKNMLNNGVAESKQSGDCGGVPASFPGGSVCRLGALHFIAG